MRRKGSPVHGGGNDQEPISYHSSHHRLSFSALSSFSKRRFHTLWLYLGSSIRRHTCRNSVFRSENNMLADEDNLYSSGLHQSAGADHTRDRRDDVPRFIQLFFFFCSRFYLSIIFSAVLHSIYLTNLSERPPPPLPPEPEAGICTDRSCRSRLTIYNSVSSMCSPLIYSL